MCVCLQEEMGGLEDGVGWGAYNGDEKVQENLRERERESLERERNSGGNQPRKGRCGEETRNGAMNGRRHGG